MLTKKGIQKILRRIMETGGMTEDMENDIKRLQDELDEREGLLKKYGKSEYERDDLDEYDFEEIKHEDGYDTEEIKKWRDKYNDLREKYLDRFFGKEHEEIMRETREDIRLDDEPQTFDELLENVEKERED